MRNDSYDEALARMAERLTAEDMAALGRSADAAALVLPMIADGIEALTVIVPLVTPEMVEEFDRRLTIELLRRGLVG